MLHTSVSYANVLCAYNLQQFCKLRQNLIFCTGIGAIHFFCFRIIAILFHEQIFSLLRCSDAKNVVVFTQSKMISGSVYRPKQKL